MVIREPNSWVLTALPAASVQFAARPAQHPAKMTMVVASGSAPALCGAEAFVSSTARLIGPAAPQ